jgi:hypothetical protein
MSETTKEARLIRCQQAVDKDRADIVNQMEEFLKAGRSITALAQNNSKAKEDLAKKFRPLLSKKNNFKNIGLGEL